MSRDLSGPIRGQYCCIVIIDPSEASIVIIGQSEASIVTINPSEASITCHTRSSSRSPRRMCAGCRPGCACFPRMCHTLDT